MDQLAVEPVDVGEQAVAEGDRIPNYGLEHGLHVGGRTADDLEDFARRRLLFQRLTQISVSRLKFLEQTHVLDRDDCLVGEGLHEFDLPLGKRANLLSSHQNASYCAGPAQQRNGEGRPMPITLLCCSSARKFLQCGGKIIDVYS